MKQYIVDAFTNKPFSGNPAAVCVMESWPSEESMMKLAMENNLSETAFIVKEEAGYHLRWFTPGTEVELCGHATLASSFVILNYYQPDSDTGTVRTRDTCFVLCDPELLPTGQRYGTVQHTLRCPDGSKKRKPLRDGLPDL